ncbi:MAG: Bug family tripartite tricarboxylate transporter substrate binding protein [Cupriavidus necator]
MKLNRRNVIRMAALSALPFPAVQALAQAWPTHPVRIVHGYDAGTNPDTISRIISPALGERIGLPVIVEPKPGAAGRIATRYVAGLPGDGYTMLMLTAGDAVVAALDRKVQYKLLEDFSFVSSVIEFPFLFCVRAGSPIKSLGDLMAAAKGQPGRVSFGTPGVGTTHSLAAELLQKQTGIELQHIPYKGNAFTDLLGARVDFLIATPSVSLPLIRSGKVRAIATTSKSALASLPDVVPVAQVVPDYEVNSWLGLAVPAATPAERVRKLSSDVQATIAVESVQTALEGTGSIVVPSNSEAFRARIERDVRKWASLVDRVKLEG